MVIGRIMETMKRHDEGTGVCSAFLLPHPPVLIPEIGKGRERDAKKTGAAYREAAVLVSEYGPETIVFVSPHAPLFSDYLFMYDAAVLKGSFARFGCPSLELEAEQDTPLREAIVSRLTAASIPAGSLPPDRLKRMGYESELDHGILVPMYFLKKEVTATKIVAISSSAMDVSELRKAGRCIAEAAKEAGRRVCVIASGDLSHKVNRESPYGEVPEGAQFDSEVCAALDMSDMDRLYGIDTELRESAAECGYASLVLVSSVLADPRCSRLSYEAPFGIGYCVAVFEK